MTQAAAGAAALMLVAPLASAQAWVFDPRIALEALYDDNYRLANLPAQEVEVTGGAIDAQFTARKEAPATLFEITPRIRSSYFPDEPDEESTDYFLKMVGERRTQRTRSRLLARYADETVVSSELLVADFPDVELGQPVSGDAGRVNVRNRRMLFGIEPSVEFDWTERRRLKADAHYVDASYDDDLFEQVGYSDVGAGLGVAWDISQRSTFSVDVLGSQYSPDDDSEDTTSVGLMGEWRKAPSELMTVYLRLGAIRAERDATGAQGSESTSSFNGGAGVAWNFQVTRIVIDALRTTVPSSQGEVVDRDELRFRATRAFSPRVSGFVALRGIHTEGLEDSGTGVSKRKYYTGRTGLGWRMTRQFSLEGAYEYKWQEYDADSSAAKSNGVMLSVVYQPRRLD